MKLDGIDQVTKAAKAATAKILRRDPNDPDPTTLIECFSGDVIRVPFFGLCEFAFFIGRRTVTSKVELVGEDGQKRRVPVYGGVSSGFVRLLPRERNPPRAVTTVPGWVPVQCVDRHRP
jgi:hypothetical protein